MHGLKCPINSTRIAGWYSYLLEPPHPAPPPPPPPPPALDGAWVGLCGRVTKVGQNHDEGGAAGGVCLQLNATAPHAGVGGSWRIEENGTQVLAQGVLPNTSLGGDLVSLELVFTASGSVTASVAGKVRFHIIRNARIENVGKYQSCMVDHRRASDAGSVRGLV